MNISILTYASGYPESYYERFIGSLMDTGFSGKVYIITTKNEIHLMEKIKYNNVVHFIDTFELTTHIYIHRWKSIQFFLKEIKEMYILLTDFRDVLFQRNIENYPLEEDIDLYFFSENKKIQDDISFNTPWIHTLEKSMNMLFYNTICHLPIICCGTTFGKTEAIRYYVNVVIDIITRYNITENIDQAIHNYIVYKIFKNFKNFASQNDVKIKVLSNDDPFVNTLGFDIAILNAKNQIVNKYYKVSYIVHQYDRCNINIKEKLSTKYNFCV